MPRKVPALIKVDLTKSPLDNEQITNRWHPDIPMACWVKPGDEFVLETFDWTGGFVKNNDSADDVRGMRPWKARAPSRRASILLDDGRSLQNPRSASDAF